MDGEYDFPMKYEQELCDVGQPSAMDCENSVDIMSIVNFSQFPQIQVRSPLDLQYSGSPFELQSAMLDLQSPMLGLQSPMLGLQSPSPVFTDEDIPRAPISNPSSPNVTGPYNFKISFDFPGDPKVSTWNYSSVTGKLYVNRDVPCPIIFSTDYEVPKNTCIRAVMFYTQPQYFHSVVQRCHDHAREDELKGLAEADHLICCDDNSVSYLVDQKTKRHSVVIPFNPCHISKKYMSTCIYKFMCLSSCDPKKKPMQIMFTLEKRNEVLGRQKVHLKVCACPNRDKKNDEMRLQKADLPQKPPMKRKSDSKKHGNPKALTPKTKTKSEEKSYTIRVADKKCYEFLMEVRGFMTSVEFRSDLEVSETTMTEDSD